MARILNRADSSKSSSVRIIIAPRLPLSCGRRQRHGHGRRRRPGPRSARWLERRMPGTPVVSCGHGWRGCGGACPSGRGTILLVDFPGGLFKQFGPVFPLGRLRMLLHGTYACSTTGAESSRRVTITRVSGPMASAQDSNRSLFQGDFMFLWFQRRAFPARSGIDRRRHEDENGRRPRMPSSYATTRSAVSFTSRGLPAGSWGTE